MFESLVIRNKRDFYTKKPIDLGFLAEAMLFYQSVTVIADKSILSQLIYDCGHEVLMELLENKFLKIEYLNNGLGINASNANTPAERLKPIVYGLPKLSLNVASTEICREYTGKSGKGRRISQRLLRNIEPISFDPHELPNEILTDFADSNFVEQSVIHIIKNFTPEYPNPDSIKFVVYKDNETLFTRTNINFEILNSFYHSRIPKTHSSLSSSYLLSHLFNLKGDNYFCTKYKSEITTDPVNAGINNIRYSDILYRHKVSQDGIRLFQDFVFENSKSIREVVNSGERTFKDLLELIEKAKKFKAWIAKKDPDKDLLKEYFKEVTAKSWIDKLPTKSVRWSIFSGIGLAIDALGASGLGTAGALAISAGDALVLDSILKGWKPNQFIEDDLKKFIKK